MIYSAASQPLSQPQATTNDNSVIHQLPETMSNKVVVHTEKGRPDSLTKSVQIVFTLTPVESEGITTSYDPVAIGHMMFSVDSDERQAFECVSKFAFRSCTYEPDQERRTCVTQGGHVDVLPGTTYKRTNSSWGHMGAVNPSKKCPSIWVKNYDQEAVVALLVKGADSVLRPIMAYHPLAHNEIIKVSTEMWLQAYIVEGEGSYNGDILTAEHLKQPIFDRPLYCNALPDVSMWRLSQDPEGAIRLREASNTSAIHSLELVAESISELRKQLSGVLATLEGTQERLAVVEAAVTTNHADLSTTLNDTRDQVARLDQVVPAVQTRVAELEGVVSHAKERTNIQQTTHLGTQDKGDDLYHKLTVLMQKPRTATVFPSRSGGMTGDRKSSMDVRDQSVGVARDQSPGAAPFEASSQMRPAEHTSTVHDQVLQPRRAEGLARGRVPVDDGRPQTQSSEAPTENLDMFVVQESVRTLRQQVAGLDRRVPALESKADKLAKGLGQTHENLTSMYKFLQTARQQLNATEARVPGIELRAEQLTAHLVDMASRLTTVEERAETLSESLLDIREARPLDWPSRSSTDNSSTNFPSGIAGSSTSLAGDSDTGTLPWLTSLNL